ncbi:MAG: pyridoxal phosphate-dependent aminotransferase [Phycisphaerales bacterium JB041]
MNRAKPPSQAAPDAPATPRPASRLAGLSPYAPPPRDGGSVLLLDANEGVPDTTALNSALESITPDDPRRYPDASVLERDIAAQLNLDPSRVTVTNGGDDAIDRVCRSVVEPGRNAVLHSPTFEMIGRGIALAGGEARDVPWLGGRFPLERYLAAIDSDTALAALVTPNNPTGGTIPTPAILALAERAAACRALLLVDLAYIEFAETDPTPPLLALDNVVMVRTFSKAFGLAGLRVGYAIAPAPVAPWLRTTGGPYPVSTLSLRIARGALQTAGSREPFLARIRRERNDLTETLRAVGAEPLASQANFVTARFDDAGTVFAALAERGVRVRAFPRHPALADYLRISLPGDADAFTRLRTSLKQVLTGDPR